MNEIQNSRKTVYRSTLLGLLTILAACGGGDDDKKDPCEAPKDLTELAACAFRGLMFNSFKSQAPVSGYDPSSAEISAVAASVDLGSVETFEINEFEPNNSPGNANVVTLPAGPIDTSVGLIIDGSVQSADDSADYFIFTPNRSGVFNAFLCAVTCAEILQDDAVYIMIYDQDQTTIAGTSVGSIVPQELAANLTSGLAYYIQIQGYNTGEGSYDYRLVIID